MPLLIFRKMHNELLVLAQINSTRAKGYDGMAWDIVWAIMVWVIVSIGIYWYEIF